MDKLSAWFSAAAEAVARLTDRWVLAGGLAADEYRATIRETKDVDLLVEWSPDLQPTLERAGYELRVIAAPDDHPHLLMARGSLGNIDFIIPTVPYQELAIDRGRARHVLTVEDVIIHKLLAGRPRDLDDIRSILAAGHTLDLDYLEWWIREWELSDRWEQVRS